MIRQIISSMYFASVVGVLLLSAAEPADAQQRAIPTREVAPPGREPYSTFFSITVTSGNGANAFSPDAIPANKRLVIEFVSARVVLPPTETPRFSLQDSVGSTSNPYLFPLTLVASLATYNDYVVAQQVRLYFDGNGANGPGAVCDRVENSFNTMTCSIAISGYLIDK